MRVHMASAPIGCAAARPIDFRDLGTAPKSVSVDQAELARQISSISASNEPAELYRQYPKCGAADFTQRAFRAT